MDTRELVRQYLKITGSNQQWIATKIHMTKTVISRWLSDKDDYVPSQDTIKKIDRVIKRAMKQLNELERID